MTDTIHWPAALIMSDSLDMGAGGRYKIGEDGLRGGSLGQDWARVAKMAEEVGEAIDALIGLTGQNPRKGYYKTWDDLYDEIADVILTGVYCFMHFTTEDNAIKIIQARQRFHMERVGLGWPE